MDEDDRLGGFAPLSLSEILPQNAPPVIVGADGDGPLFDPAVLTQGDNPNTVQLPAEGGGTTSVRIEDLDDDQLAQIQQILGDGAFDLRNPLTGDLPDIQSNGNGGVNIQSPFRSPIGINPNLEIGQNLRNEQRRRDEFAQEVRRDQDLRNARFGLSSPQAEGQSISDLLANPLNTGGPQASRSIQASANQWFDAQIEQVNIVGRATEERLRTALLDINAFIDSELGRDVDLTASQTIALRESYQQQLDEVREIRTSFGDELAARQRAVLAGDYGALPESLRPNDATLAQIQFEEQSLQQTQLGFERWRPFAISDNFQDRWVAEIARGAVNGTYSPRDIQFQLDPPGQGGEGKRFTPEEVAEITRRFLEITGFDEETLTPSEDSPTVFDVNYLTPEQAQMFDAFTVRFDQDFDQFLRPGERQVDLGIIQEQLDVEAIRAGTPTAFAGPGEESRFNVFDPTPEGFEEEFGIPLEDT